jgi:hypothetical protein
MSSRTPLLVLTGLFLVRLAVSAVHGHAHDELAVPLATWQNVFVWGVITIAPTVTMIVLWFRPSSAAAWTLAALLAASWLFGLFFHFGPPNPDHVGSVPDLPGRDLFAATAVALAIVEPATVLAAVWLARRLGQRRMTSHG